MLLTTKQGPLSRVVLVVPPGADWHGPAAAIALLSTPPRQQVLVAQRPAVRLGNTEGTFEVGKHNQGSAFHMVGGFTRHARHHQSRLLSFFLCGPTRLGMPLADSGDVRGVLIGHLRQLSQRCARKSQGQ